MGKIRQKNKNKQKKIPEGIYKGISSDKKCRVSSDSQPDDSKYPVWRFSLLDVDGQFGWRRITEKELQLDLLPRIKNFETMTWQQILGSTGSHLVELKRLVKDAQKRIIDLKQDDIPGLVSLRVSGRKRVWGIRRDNIFNVLWWDPEDEVCPSQKKHT